MQFFGNKIGPFCEWFRHMNTNFEASVRPKLALHLAPGARNEREVQHLESVCIDMRSCPVCSLGRLESLQMLLLSYIRMYKNGQRVYTIQVFKDKIGTYRDVDHQPPVPITSPQFHSLTSSSIYQARVPIPSPNHPPIVPITSAQYQSLDLSTNPRPPVPILLAWIPNPRRCDENIHWYYIQKHFLKTPGQN